MGSNKLIRIIVPIITAVVSIAAMVIAGFFVIRAIKDSSKDLEIEKTRIETEYSELGENNTPYFNITVIFNFFREKSDS